MFLCFKIPSGEECSGSRAALFSLKVLMKPALTLQFQGTLTRLKIILEKHFTDQRRSKIKRNLVYLNALKIVLFLPRISLCTHFTPQNYARLFNIPEACTSGTISGSTDRCLVEIFRLVLP